MIYGIHLRDEIVLSGIVPWKIYFLIGFRITHFSIFNGMQLNADLQNCVVVINLQHRQHGFRYEFNVDLVCEKSILKLKRLFRRKLNVQTSKQTQWQHASRTNNCNNIGHEWRRFVKQ